MDKKAVFIIAFKEFRDEEYFIPKKLLESAGIKTTTASTSKGVAIGKLGGDADVDISIDDLKVSDYDAVVFSGGSGAVSLIDNNQCHKIAQDAAKENKILAAICSASAVLAKAGVLKDRKATVWSSAMDKSLIDILKESGADYQDSPVVVDENIITSSGPSFSQQFGEKILEALNK